MKNEKRNVTINIKPFHMEVEEINMTGFTLKFYDNIGDDCTRHKYVRVRLEWWWMSFIVDTLKKAYSQQKAKFMSFGKNAGFEKQIMSEYTPEEFNEAMARLDGKCWNDYRDGMIVEFYPEPLPDYFNDLNLLMPLAWKHVVECISYHVTNEGIQSWLVRNYKLQNCINTDPIKAIRDCLWAIAKGDR